MAEKQHYRVYLDKDMDESGLPQDVFADGFSISDSGALMFYDDRGRYSLAYRDWYLVELVK